MRGIIDNIITFYEVRAKALSILITNTQKALKQLDGKRKANEQAERIENFVKELTMDVSNMLRRFYFHNERKKRKHEQMTDDEEKTLAGFVSFVKTLTRNVHSLICRFQKVNGQTYEENLDREIKEIEAHVRQRLKEYDEALSGKSKTLKYRLSKYVSNKVASINKFFRRKGFDLEVTQKAKLDGHQAQRLEDAPIDSIDSRDTQLENFIDVLNINAGGSSSKKSERQIHLEV